MQWIRLFAPAVSILLLASSPQEIFTVPLSVRGDTLRLLVTGDAGTGDPHVYAGAMAVIKKMHVNAIILTGDNVYPCGVESIADPQWHKMTVNFADAGIPIYPVLGNHDYGNPTPHHTTFCGNPSPGAQVAATGHIPHWIFPARRYELRSPVAELIMIDTQPIASAWTTPFRGSDTAASEMEIIQRALQRPFSGWRIVVGHHTIFSSGPHGNPPDLYTRNMRQALLPLFDRHHVDLYVCGHDHDTELIGSLRLKRGDTDYLIAGNGAYSQPMKSRNRSAEPPTLFPPFPPKPLVGFTLLEITKSKLEITFYDGLGVARSPTLHIQRAGG